MSDIFAWFVFLKRNLVSKWNSANVCTCTLCMSSSHTGSYLAV